MIIGELHLAPKKQNYKRMKYLFFIYISAILYLGSCKNENPRIKLVSEGTKQQSIADLKGPWQLLVDDYLVDKKENIKRTYHPFTKYSGNPVLVADKPWEGRISYVYGTVLPNEKGKGYRLWYQSWLGEYTNMYATSQDGLNWEKPELGIIDFKGSKANNIFFRRTKEDHLPQIIFTPWEKDPNRRYKLLNYDYGRTKPNNLVSGFYGAYSGDGIHWKDVRHNPVFKDPGDVSNFVWDSHKNRYIGYPKIFAPVRGFNRRCVGFSATKDFENWPSTQLILIPDEKDDSWVSLQNQRTEFYGLSAFPYESGYLGLLWIFHITDGNNDGPIYCEIVSSRDGIYWVRQEALNGNRLPILPIGPKSTWDQGMVFSTNHPLVENATIKLWYGGSNVTHDAPDDDFSRSGIGLATLRKDGFASLDASETIGTVTTKPLINLRGPLYVNANASAGSIKVEVMTADGNVVPGFSRIESEAIKSDGINLQVSWRNSKNLPDLPGALRLRFILQNAALYSFMGGKGVNLAPPVQLKELHLTFEKTDIPPKGFLFKEKALDEISDFNNSCCFHGNVSIIEDSVNSAKGVGVARFLSDTKQSSNNIELLNTTYLGPKFTLTAMVKTTSKKLTRLFSNYRGSGELVTGELLFDFDPTGDEIPGLRFVVNGQSVLSKQLKFDDGMYHQLAVTYDLGKVTFYLDGLEVGQRQLLIGAAHLSSNKTVLRYFEQPNALPEVGIYLGNNLHVGGDTGGRFVTYKDEVTELPKAQLTGFVDEILVVRSVMTAPEILQVYRTGIQSWLSAVKKLSGV